MPPCKKPGEAAEKKPHHSITSDAIVSILENKTGLDEGKVNEKSKHRAVKLSSPERTIETMFPSQ